MARARKKRENKDKASPDLTPMIDVTFQLLIFFILCTRFKVEERNHQVELPKDEGLESKPSIPKEQITIYCEWKPEESANTYKVAIGARGRVPVDESYATLSQMVIFPDDKSGAILEKKRRYAQIFDRLVVDVEKYIKKAGVKRIEKLEISFAVKATEGAKSGTAPWMFVSLAIDASAQVNKNRIERDKLDPLPVNFKFADSLGKFGG